MILSNDGLVAFHYRSYGTFFYNKIGSIISIGGYPLQIVQSPNNENSILHSDQSWHYQHASYYQFLEDKGIQLSFSHKGKGPDNGIMESFFGILKSLMFYCYEKMFQSINQLERAIADYIVYQNNKRIKVKLK